MTNLPLFLMCNPSSSISIVYTLNRRNEIPHENHWKPIKQKIFHLNNENNLNLIINANIELIFEKYAEWVTM